MLTLLSEDHLRKLDITAAAAVVTPHRKAFTEDHQCELLRYHAPIPVMTNFHHSKPVFLQNFLYGRIMFGPDLWVCSNCHDAVHAWLYWLLGMRKQPPHIGYAAKKEAERELEWFLSEKERLKIA